MECTHSLGILLLLGEFVVLVIGLVNNHDLTRTWCRCDGRTLGECGTEDNGYVIVVRRRSAISV